MLLVTTFWIISVEFIGDGLNREALFEVEFYCPKALLKKVLFRRFGGD